jgi:hypothetical protein
LGRGVRPNEPKAHRTLRLIVGDRIRELPRLLEVRRIGAVPRKNSATESTPIRDSTIDIRQFSSLHGGDYPTHALDFPT